MRRDLNALDYAAIALLIIGGINWGLVAIAEFDLVAEITGETFGTTNAATRIIYGLVGLAALYTIYTLSKLLSAREVRETRTPRSV